MEYRMSEDKLEQNEERIKNYIKMLGIEKSDTKLILNRIIKEL